MSFQLCVLTIEADSLETALIIASGHFGCFSVLLLSVAEFGV